MSGLGVNKFSLKKDLSLQGSCVKQDWNSRFLLREIRLGAAEVIVAGELSRAIRLNSCSNTGCEVEADNSDWVRKPEAL